MQRPHAGAGSGKKGKLNMKKMILMALSMGLATAANAMEIEVAPLALQAKAEVVGIRAEVDGRAALIFTGKAAQKLAKATGVVIDTSTQMLVATGAEVEELVVASAGAAIETGHIVLVTSAKFGKKAMNLALEAAAQGARITNIGLKKVSKATAAVLETAVAATEQTVAWVGNKGLKILSSGLAILGSVLDLLNPFPFLF
jgi:hypothetical protein